MFGRICDLPHHIYGGHVGFRFSVVDGSILLSYLRSLLMKMSLDSLIRKIFVIE